MELRQDTKDLCHKLQTLYNEKEILFESQYEERSINNNIQEVLSQLLNHCDQHYQAPWFRIYTYWQVHYAEPGLLALKEF